MVKAVAEDEGRRIDKIILGMKLTLVCEVLYIVRLAEARSPSLE